MKYSKIKYTAWLAVVGPIQKGMLKKSTTHSIFDDSTSSFFLGCSGHSGQFWNFRGKQFLPRDLVSSITNILEGSMDEDKR